MEAKEYLDFLKDANAIIRLAHFCGDDCDGRGQAAVLAEEYQIAVMLEDCGDPNRSGVRAGDLVKYVVHPEVEPKIIGSPASVRR
jgi:hypothetical protein